MNALPASGVSRNNGAPGSNLAAVQTNMNSQHQPDDDLRSALRDWRITAPLPPRFHEQVWRRIESRETPGTTLWEMFRARLESLFVRPAFAVSYIAVLVAAGLIAGFWQAQARVSSVEVRLADKYVQSIDPYQKPGHLP
jgi:hypothetical protein